MRIIVVGQGAFARELLTLSEAVPFYPGLEQNDSSVLVHAGSGTELDPALAWCAAGEAPFIEAVAGQQELYPKVFPCPFIEAPNLALGVAQFLAALPAMVEALFAGGMQTLSLEESHQVTKLTAPGTALRIARIVGMPERDIKSIRSEQHQRSIGVPPEYLKQHAQHRLVFGAPGVRIELSTQVLGLRPYVHGARLTAELLLRHRNELHNERYDLSELLTKFN